MKMMAITTVQLVLTYKSFNSSSLHESEQQLFFRIPLPITIRNFAQIPS